MILKFWQYPPLPRNLGKECTHKKEGGGVGVFDHILCNTMLPNKTMHLPQMMVDFWKSCFRFTFKSQYLKNFSNWHKKTVSSREHILVLFRYPHATVWRQLFFQMAISWSNIFQNNLFVHSNLLECYRIHKSYQLISMTKYY